ncbi:cAMP-binding domain of CRP or a regulatory subunit of cAMP-dependent protein kinases [Tropicimonas isoalkanivorans]|uniref:cAMP-binding domain of CRP or a regulatory subunit of cAMP-dependent protein kinases n=2 Tax=Tropicimonas isoalkanivorans TaxID=441112 RepID=A0A1I1JIR5_9RHOB|nr:cAMP-binding domain of CRP or a regulatory subunit of cAMP-dependent protein kinases [Tropicimonas isoalkanivorans]
MTYGSEKIPLHCSKCPLRRLDLFLPFDEEEIKFMESFKSGDMIVEPGTHLFIEGAEAAQLYTVLSGLGIRYKTLENGRRQVVNFVMPGDFLGLQAGVMQKMSHSIEVTTKMRLCVFERSRFYELYKNQPDRGYSLTYLAALEEYFLAEALTTVGQRGALEKVSWGLHRFRIRGEALGLLKNGKVPLPFKQQDLADALGLSLVHTNKTLAKLRSDGIANWQDGELEVKDFQALTKLAMVEDFELPKRPLI